MSLNLGDRVLDLRRFSAKEKRRMLFKAWDELGEGGALLLLSNEDMGLYYHQFACQFLEQFEWASVEQGPTIWVVRISKRRYAEPRAGSQKAGVGGSVAGPGVPAGAKRIKPLVLDARPILEVGGVPCAAIDEAVSALAPGQRFVLLVPFLPEPLLAKLAREGFVHRSIQTEDGSWRIEFRRAERVKSI